MRYLHENDFDTIVFQAASAWNVEAALIKAIIAAESEFNYIAYRFEPHIGDASYGLMQLLYGTSKALGFTGPATGLYDPTTNIRLGTRFLADLSRTAAQRQFGIDSAISAYNGGFSAVRPGDGKRVTNEPGSPFINQAYVDKVLRLAGYFRHGAASQLEEVTVYARQFPSWAFLALPALFFIFPKRHRR